MYTYEERIRLAVYRMVEAFDKTATGSSKELAASVDELRGLVSEGPPIVGRLSAAAHACSRVRYG